MSPTPSTSPPANLIPEVTVALQTWVFPALQIFCLFLLFVGLVLLSPNVRNALGSLYARIYIRRVRGDAQTEARKLATSVCDLLYLAPDGRLSAIKTLALATASFLLVAALLANARVWYGSSVCEPPCTASFQFVMFTWSGEKPDMATMDGLPPEGRTMSLQSAEARSALPLAFAFHWSAEAIAGLLFMRLTRNSKRNFLLAAPLALICFLVALSMAPTLLSAAALYALAHSGVQPSWNLLLATQTALANGPGLAFGSWSDPFTFGHGVAMSNPRAFSLALLSSLTFATGLLAVVLANASARSRLVLAGLELMLRNGAARPVLRPSKSEGRLPLTPRVLSGRL